MKAEELLKRMQEHDLVAIKNDDKKVHLVWLGERSQLRFCVLPIPTTQRGPLE